MKGKWLIPLALALAVSACTTSRQTFGPDGRTASSITCSGLALTWANCYEKAGAICGARGYDVLAVNGETGAIITANPQGAFGSSVINRTMLVSCKTELKTQSASPAEPKKVRPTGAMPGSPDCPTRVVSAGGNPIPPEEQCLPMPPQ